MRVPRLRSLVLLFALVVWFGAVRWYWKHRLPLVPVDVIRYEDGWAAIRQHSPYNQFAPEFVTLLDNGNLVLAKRELLEDFGWGRIYGLRGPIRVWDPVHHRVVHEIKEVQERIEEAWICRNGTAVVQSQEFVTAIDLHEGRVVLRLPAVEGFQITLSPDARFVVLFDPIALRPTVYDSHSGRPMFAAEMSNDRIEFIRWNTAIVDRYSSSKRQVLSTLTWQPVQEPEKYGYPVGFSAGGRFVIARNYENDEQTLVDCVDEQPVARFPDLGEVTASRWHFCRKDSELVQIVVPGPDLFDRDGPLPMMEDIGTNRFQIIRRGTSDGRVLGRATVDQDRVFPASGVSPDGRLLIAYREGPPLSVPAFVWQQAARLNLGWLFSRRSEFVAVDTETGTVKTVVAPVEPRQSISELWWRPGVDFCDHGFCVATEEELMFFAYPLQRRWLWQLGWALGPPAVVWCMRLLLAYRRRRSGASRGCVTKRDNILRQSS
jgi:hypothetical protein